MKFYYTLLIAFITLGINAQTDLAKAAQIVQYIDAYF